MADEKSKGGAMVWGGRVLSALVVAFMAMDATMKLMVMPIVVETGKTLGWGPGTAFPLGIILLVSTLLYAIPQTSVLGAILLTGYLGGAEATHMRVGSPAFSYAFGAGLGVMVWGGLFLRDPRVRALIPLRR